MKVSALIGEWESNAKARLTAEEYCIHLPVEDAARIAALQEMYPLRSELEIIAGLLRCALDEVEGSLPYIPGKKVAGTDEMGDPFYEDEGLTPRFLKLARKHQQQIKKQASRPNRGR